MTYTKQEIYEFNKRRIMECQAMQEKQDELYVPGFVDKILSVVYNKL